MHHLILIAMAMRLELCGRWKLRALKIQWATQENSATEQQIWAVTILCTPACALSCHEGLLWTLVFRYERGQMLCLQTSALVHPLSLVFAGILRDYVFLSDWGHFLVSLLPLSPSSALCQKLFLSKDRKVNSLSTPHLTYKMEIELLFFKKHTVMKWLLKNSAIFRDFQGVLYQPEANSLQSSAQNSKSNSCGEYLLTTIMCQALFLILEKIISNSH